MKALTMTFAVALAAALMTGCNNNTTAGLGGDGAAPCCATSTPCCGDCCAKGTCDKCAAGKCDECPTCKCEAADCCAKGKCASCAGASACCDDGTCDKCQAAACCDDGNCTKCQAAKAKADAAGSAMAVTNKPLTDDAVVVNVRGLSCPLCATNVKKVLQDQQGVTDVQVDMSTGRVTVGMEGDTRPTGEQVRQGVVDAGFTFVSMEKKGASQ